MTPISVKYDKPERMFVYNDQSIFWLTDQSGIPSCKNITIEIVNSDILPNVLNSINIKTIHKKVHF
jgi:hypothetical protein